MSPDSPPNALLHRCFEARAKASPEAPALVWETGSWTYRTLGERADRWAHLVIRRGVRPDSRVALFLERSPETVAALVGVLGAGAAYVPIDPSHPDPRVRLLVEDSGASLVLTTEDLAPRLPPGVPALRLEEAAEELAGVSPERPAVAVEPESLAYVLYTSGSTGTPKAVAVSHRSIATHLRWLLTAFPLGPEDVVLHKTALSFDSSLNEIFGALGAGARLVVAPPGIERDAGAQIEAVRRHGVTVMETVPAMLRLLLDDPDFADSTTLKRIQCGGEELPAEVVEGFLALRRKGGPRADLINLYGPTETTIEVTAWRAEALGEDRRVPIGTAVAGARIHLLDEALQPVPEGEAGELWVGGPVLARGYLGRPRQTAERFVPDPFAAEPGGRLYKTGDLVRRRSDGNLLFLGRADDQVKIRGFRIELGEIEAALTRHPQVAEAVVLAPGDGASARRLVAWVAPSSAADRPPETGQLRGFLAASLPEHMVPAAFVGLLALPRTPSGKVDRRALPQPAADRSGATAAFVAPRTDTEQQMTEVMSGLLGISPLGADDDFFELGGHSLLALRLLAEVRRRFDRDIPLPDLFAGPTAAALAARLDALEAAGERPGATLLPAVAPVPRPDGRAPLSPSQERVVFLQQLDPENLAYQFQDVLIFDGVLDADALRRSLDDIVRRHEIYRTTFEAVEGETVQVIHPPGPAAFEVVDLAHLGAEEAEAEARWHIAQATRRLFDIRRLPVVAWTLYRLHPRRHLMLHLEHHLVHDGWAFNLFLDELLATYRALVKGEAPPLPMPEVQFADFATLQRRWMDGPDGQAQLDWWVERLAGCPPLEGLPYDRPLPSRQTFEGDCFRVDLPGDLCDAVRALARRHGATPFMVFYAAFAALLHRWTRQEDLTIGTAVGNRRWPASEGLYGMLVNNVALRNDLGGDPPLDRLVAQVREVTLAAWDRQEMSFERVVEALKPERDGSRNPVFQVTFSFHDSPLPELGLEDLDVRLDEAIFNGSAKFELNVIGIPRLEQRVGAGTAGERGVALVWEYNRDLFDRPTMERMVGHYRNLLAAGTADPGRPLSRLPLLSEAERQQLLGAWNDTAVPRPEVTLDGLLAERAARHPARVAVRCEGESLTYRELSGRVRRLAAHLRRLGVGPERVVALFLERSADLIVASWAVLEAGGAYLPLDPGHPAQRTAWILDDSRAAVVVTHARHLGDLPSGSTARLCVLDEEKPRPAAEPAPAAAAPGMEAGPENPAYILYTSGSTGRPKAVTIPHRALVNHMLWMEESFPLTPEDRVLQKTPLVFDASVWEVWAPLLAGATLVLARPGGHEDPGYLVDRLIGDQITVLQVVPLLLRMLVEEPRLAQCRFLHRLYCGGDRLAPELVETVRRQLPGLEVINLYGPTEATIDTVAGVCGEAAPGDRDSVPVGSPVANTRAHVLDRALQLVPAGARGELHLGGSSLARGYLGRPALTAERFVPDPFSPTPGGRLYRTGDLARRLRDGRLEIVGRADHQVKVRGFRIELGEIEAVLGRHPAVAECAVLARDDGDGDRRLVAYVAGRGGAPDAADLRPHLQRSLPAYMVPAAWVVLPSLPRTASGKLDRRTLPAPETADLAASDYVAPRTEVEELLAEIWRELIRVERVGATDNFFHLGGHSLHAARHMYRLRSLLGVDLPLRSLYETPTLGELAAVIETRLVEAFDTADDAP